MEQELAHIREQANALKARWSRKKRRLPRYAMLKRRIESSIKLEEQTRKGDYNRAAQIKYGELPQLEAELTKLARPWTASGRAC